MLNHIYLYPINSEQWHYFLCSCKSRTIVYKYNLDIKEGHEAFKLGRSNVKNNVKETTLLNLLTINLMVVKCPNI